MAPKCSRLGYAVWFATRVGLLGWCMLAVSCGGLPSRASDSDTKWGWQRTADSVALLNGKAVVWQFNYSRDHDVPYFHPLSTVTGQVLSLNQPPDHVWHHGLWFSWKFINSVNYWEINSKTRKPDGRTTWEAPRLETSDDGSAVIALQLSYRPAADDDQVFLHEQRRMEISVPDDGGIYQLDWTSTFTAGGGRVVLDRTPPREQSWGGYAGLSIRFAERFTDRQAVGSKEIAEFGQGGRHRSRAAAMDYTGQIDGRTAGVAFLDHPENPRHPTPWYLIRSPDMSYMNAALLADEPLTLDSGEQLTLRYRVIVHPDRWSAETLQKAHALFARRQRGNQPK